jgi:hypothetical protein
MRMRMCIRLWVWVQVQGPVGGPLVVGRPFFAFRRAGAGREAEARSKKQEATSDIGALAIGLAASSG